MKELNISSLYSGTFFTTIEQMRDRLADVRCVLWDWDGVFNDGYHPQGRQSIFSEVDSMGTNMLRCAYWLRHQSLPITGIVTGQHNEQAHHFAQREHMHFICKGAKDKGEALAVIKQQYALEADQIAFIWDDILDFPIAAEAGVRIQINRGDVNPLLNTYVEDAGLADYRTRYSGSQHGNREACELLSVLLGTGLQAMHHRSAWDATYRQYWADRQSIQTTELIVRQY